MSDYVAFVDESGNHDLATEKDGASNYFIVLAVIIPTEQRSELEIAIEKIRLKYFNSNEIKSSKLSNERRLKIVNEISSLDFKFYAVCVDKSRIIKDSGLQYKKSFIKFTNGLLYNQIFSSVNNITIYADGHGGSNFIDSFSKYISENHIPDLFFDSKIEIVDSKNQILVQLADFLVGTTAKLYEGRVSGQTRDCFLRFIQNKRIRIDEWPPKFETNLAFSNSSNAIDTKISNISLQKASEFLRENFNSSDREIKIQYATLSYLLFRARFPFEKIFTSTNEILDHLKDQGFHDITKQYLRSNAIAKLRDHDVVIASSTKGYKIPASYADLIGFADLVDGIAIPLLSRLKKADEIFDFGSIGEIKFLNEQRFQSLQAIIKNMK
ncbi:hypothetical protein JAB8_04670 [Janthinobacterium sp. HH106]|uniref:DUF3800 domain-containing protein n=1 Tax=Janthinobacterium sp. HH106 TaxID=1537278 RepID=UPI000892F491|nr:DUF3800 domain-containing protein [Janthinobacterium sp. HH106]OEZ93351.1 hypothetical protein JAB8_04670 [Janthinobacterium sp. HH106]